MVSKGWLGGLVEDIKISAGITGARSSSARHDHCRLQKRQDPPVRTTSTRQEMLQ